MQRATAGIEDEAAAPRDGVMGLLAIISTVKASHRKTLAAIFAKPTVRQRGEEPDRLDDLHPEHDADARLANVTASNGQPLPRECARTKCF